MGRSYSQCSGCSFGYENGDEYSAECECGGRFCCKECGKLKNYKPYDDEVDEYPEDDGVNRIDKDKPVSCILCRKEHYTDKMLLDAALKHFNITEKEAIKIWRNS